MIRGGREFGPSKTPEIQNGVSAKQNTKTHSVIPASNLRKVCPPSPVVITLSWTLATKQPAMANKYVPGSISKLSSLPPFSFANVRNSSATGEPHSTKLVDGSPGFRPTLYPPPKLRVWTVSQSLQNPKDLTATDFHISGSDPDPMCVCTLSTTRSYFDTIEGTVPSVTDSCHIPKEEDGPPTLVLEKVVLEDEKPPDPTPGLIRTPTGLPVP